MEQKRVVKIADCFYLDERRSGLGLFSRPALFWKSGGGDATSYANEMLIRQMVN